jgi:tRNA-Thr(GGU) m(6)t(6)A37 methyltransferase TsaA
VISGGLKFPRGGKERIEFMQVKHSLDVLAEPVEGVPGVSVRWLWSESDGAPAFALRLFEVEPGASTPYHRHAHEHEVYVLSGQALLRGKSQERSLVPGDTVLVLPHEEHQFKNTGSEKLRFLCSIPFLGKDLESTAQVSLYPLRELDLAPAIGKALEIFRQQGLQVTPGMMSTVISGDIRRIFQALQRVFEMATDEGDAVMVATFSNACPVPSEGRMEHPSFRAIGYVENEFSESTSPDVLRAGDSKIVIQADYSDGLMGLNVGDRLLVVFHFHRSEGYNLHQHPRGDRSRPRRGVFSLRSPKRPNPIGITEVQLLEIKDNVLTVRGLDALDGTPVLDLKPA